MRCRPAGVASAPFPPAISSAITLRMEAGARGKTYKIGQAAKLLDVKPFVLRFWEGEFKDVLVPVRTPSGQRAYTEGNVELVREIKRLLYDEGLTIEGAKKRLREAKAAKPRVAQPRPSAEPAAPSGADQTPSAQAANPAPCADALPLLAAAHSLEQPGPDTQADASAEQALQAARQQAAQAEDRADEAAARAESLAQALTHFRQELLAIRNLLG